MTTPADTAEIVPSIHQAMSAVMAQIGGVAKTSKNQQQGYMFRGIDAFMAAAQPAMVANGVFVCPEVIDRQAEQRATKAGGVSTHVVCRVKFTFYGPAGDSVTATTDGEAADTADKATNKCMSQALKYALMQVFCVPLESEKDPDHDTPDMGQLGKAPPAPNTERLASKDQTAQFIALAEAGGLDKADRKAIVLADTGRQFWKDVTATEADELIGKLKADGFELAQEGSGRWIAYPTGQEPFELDGGSPAHDAIIAATATDTEDFSVGALAAIQRDSARVQESLEAAVEASRRARAGGPVPTHRQDSE